MDGIGGNMAIRGDEFQTQPERDYQGFSGIVGTVPYSGQLWSMPPQPTDLSRIAAALERIADRMERDGKRREDREERAAMMRGGR